MGGYMNTSKSNEWETPRWLFYRLNEIFHFEVDLACTPKNQKCKAGIYESTIKGARIEAVYQNNSFWCNPPYSDILTWVKNCFEIGCDPKFDKTVVMLIPASTELKAWHDFIWPYARYILFFNRRLKFEIKGIPQGSSPKGSALVIFTNQSYDLSSLSDLGQVIDMEKQRSSGGDV